MADILAIDQDTDRVTQYIQAFREKFIFGTFAKDFPRHKLHRARNGMATRKSVDQILSSYTISFITGSGHGFPDAFTGHSGQTIWSTSHDLRYLSGKIVHLLSCRTGSGLGRKLLSDGIRAFWGYSKEFWFEVQRVPPTRPEDDQEAQLYIQMDLVVVRGILRGLLPSDIITRILNYYSFMTKQNLRKAQQALLLSNLQHLVGPSIDPLDNWGDTSAVL